MSDSTFNEWLSKLHEGNIIKQFIVKGSRYYALAKWGENILDMENMDGFTFLSALIIYQTSYEMELKKGGLHGGYSINK